ncbi:hypothetical protein LOD99_14141 [Oopsacas minuta]|uniref:Amino acid transporter transmembrane domain-containing protein n=1 Tax=Oopsacas minuta TaxID=111878 RepID=A0AAV7KGT2_9METZ|nr:hypothetical protein LOD99_14141 [Oopsacas minuta]
MNINIVQGYFYIINYTLGSGFLSLPYIFYKAGTLVTTVSYVFYCVVGCVCALYVVEFLGRVKVIDRRSQSDESQPLLNNTESRDDLFLHSQNRKYEISESGQILFCFWANMLVVLIICCECVTTLWAYSALVASTLATNLPIDTNTFLKCSSSQFIKRLPNQYGCLNLYRVAVAGYGIIVLFLSVIGLKKQKYLQLILGIARFIIIASIIVFSFVKIVFDQINPQIMNIHTTNSTNLTHVHTYSQTILRFNIAYIFYGIPIFLYSLQNNFFLPTALFTVTNKKLLKSLTIVVFMSIGVLVTTLGISVSLAFLHNINPNCVLNWIPYTHESYHISLRIFSYIVIFFPVIELLSCYPLSTILQANLLFQIIMRTDTSQIETFKQQMILVSLRCLIALLPILLSLFVANLIVITDISGIFSISLMLILPVVFQWRSQRLIELMYDMSGLASLVNKKLFDRIGSFMFTTRAHTPYSGWYSGFCVQISVAVISVITLLIAISSVVLQLANNLGN